MTKSFSNFSHCSLLTNPAHLWLNFCRSCIHSSNIMKIKSSSIESHQVVQEMLSSITAAITNGSSRIVSLPFQQNQQHKSDYFFFFVFQVGWCHHQALLNQTRWTEKIQNFLLQIITIWLKKKLTQSILFIHSQKWESNNKLKRKKKKSTKINFF